ncbi:MAG TPA: selenocysteine-specific translation elongation factor [Solirubrobacteraceae bacterium]|jgi:selenocysteine-specific elongation factor|nr:selenocysteine-specific translation elongation factor [Solirubrobacteraceae bacterium]
MEAEHAAALTLGTAGHIDHGKTALVQVLTGVDTDRLPQEKARGMSIELGFAPLLLPGGRRISVVDVPGHERFVRTMVAGATGIDFFLMVIAADDGVMPQTLEHAEVLAALGIEQGVVAITKSDRADPESAAAEAAELFATAEIVACSARTGVGVGDVAAALERAAERVAPHAERDRKGPAVLHIDRAFTIHGAGTVVTGTLWSGALTVGDTLTLLPAQRPVRVRSLQVHDEPAERAFAGQRVAVNLAAIARRDVSRGDALADPAAQLVPTQVIDAAIDLGDDRHGRRVMVHHGTRAVAARLAALGTGLWQVRLEVPLLAAAGDRLVVRSVAPPDTLAGGLVLDPRARRHGRRADILARLERIRRGEPEPVEPPAGGASAEADGTATTAGSQELPLDTEAIELAARLLAAGHEPLSRAELSADAAHLPTLIQAGIAVRIGRDLYAHRDALAVVAERVSAIIADEGAVTLARLRDELATSRKYAEALLEHLDQARYTKRLPDDRRVLRRRA